MSHLDITAVSKLKHADLWAAAKRLGSQAALARALGVRQDTIGRWINLQDYPHRKKRDGSGRLTHSVEYYDELDIKLLLHVGKGLDELFPDELREAEAFLKANKTIETTRSVPVRALLNYAEHSRGRMTYDQCDVEHSLDMDSLKQSMSFALGTLGEREREVVKLRYGIGHDKPHTLDEVARIFNSTRERIRQIEMKAIRELQRYDSYSQLVGYL